MNQQLLKTKFEIQQKQQLIYSLNRDIVRNESENESLRFKIEILEDEIRELGKTDKK